MKPEAGRRRLIGLTMGDPFGIGPEVILKALADRKVTRLADFVVLGSPVVLLSACFGLRMPFRLYRVDEATVLRTRKRPRIALLPVSRVESRLDLLGRCTAEGGKAAAQCVKRGIRLALDGTIDALVTAPLSKEAIHRAGYLYPGHTEMLAKLTHTRKAVMMMVGGGLRVALVTTHLAVKEVPTAVTTTEVLATLTITDSALKRFFGFPRPRLGVCGLNPHCGEAGQFGDEETRVIAPALAAARKKGIDCSDPIPADVIFGKALRGQFDAVVAMYHDQANIPVKLLAFDTGVNVTLGLPIIRTSPDHGTAYDIAGKGVANPSSLVEAIKLAVAMASKRVGE